MKGQNSITGKRAVALSYNSEVDIAPVIKAKGKGYVAEEIIARAKSNNIPLQEDKSLVELLAQMEVNDRIPADLYGVVAEVFSFVYQLDKSQEGKNS
ncbi:flagellar biosynthesis protein [Evansella vedderi]|uniref:Flagellar biosynthesis protein n=1 Tax=Evansella vedderi TaxID=38282 RepID=A0ABT9ZRZ2_9BACI|nr:EscU/YscU/HrcU family type III secretion system export apparatus switch protein [Evansella vedderi]MDQ0253730.1 flagellar biosynthesis protein [Evansella vedderi]